MLKICHSESDTKVIKTVLKNCNEHRCDSSCFRCSVKNGVLGIFTKFIRKHGGLRPATLLKNSLWHSCFPVNFVKFPRTLFL